MTNKMIEIKRSPISLNKKSALLEMMKDEESTVRFNINMPKSLHTDFKILSANKGIKMTDIVISLVLNYIKSELDQ